MNACIGLVLLITSLRLYLYWRQCRFLLADGKGSPYAVAIVRMCMAGTALESVAACSVLKGIEVAGSWHASGGCLALAALVVLQCLIELALSALKIFVVDSRFGFNRLTAACFLIETAQALLTRAFIGAALAILALVLLRLLGSWWWLPFTIVIALFARTAGAWFSGHVASRPQHRSPLSGGMLAERLKACAARCGFDQAELVMALGSLRSTQANAHIEQRGKSCRVVLLDTLAEGLRPVEIEAVVAHELGHLFAGHLERRDRLLFAIWLAVAAAASGIAGTVFPIPEWRQVAVALVLAPPLRFLLQPLLNASLRGWEFEADAFATRHVPPAALADALTALFSINAAAAVSDAWYAVFHASHPPLAQRLERLSEA